MRLARHLALVVALSAAGFGAPAAAPGPDEEAVYTLTVTLRANKIVAALDLADTAKAARVAGLVAQHYRDLRDIQAVRDSAIKSAKAAFADKTAVESATKSARDTVDAQLEKLHPAFLARLAAELPPAQIDQIKDGMTYGVVPLTYRVYLEMLPKLTAEQKTQIHAWLVEAREHAIDGFTSDEKHAWFGKYKGRINNFLARAGYDMKQAEKEMNARQKAAPVAK